tara:strand:- start:1284 stop:1472 length:189 start_codon:yes stop_codon:yes gene_type:complete
MTAERAAIFRLAEQLGKTVGALLREMSGAELIAWGKLGEWEHEKKQRAEFLKAGAINGNYRR